jgi:hypothetical protein
VSNEPGARPHLRSPAHRSGHWWAGVIGIFLGERLYAFVMLAETRPWLLFGIVVNVLMPTWLPAALGALGVHLGNRWCRKGTVSP